MADRASGALFKAECATRAEQPGRVSAIEAERPLRYIAVRPSLVLLRLMSWAETDWSNGLVARKLAASRLDDEMNRSTGNKSQLLHGWQYEADDPGQPAGTDDSFDVGAVGDDALDDAG